MKKLTNFVSIISIVVFLFPFSEALAMDKDTLRVYWFDPVEVTAKRVGWGNTQFPIERDNYTKLFNTSGYTMIRKGVFFAQDIYVDGFKRGDINVVIDGEHYHNACPNRMDSPLTRINPMEMKTIDLIKNGGGLQSGLAGTISFHREQPSELFKIKGGLNHTLASSHSSDAAFTITSHNYRFNGRYATGSAYKDAKGRSFVDLYGYKDDYRYNLGELSFQGSNKEWDYRASYSYTEDVMFPYLMMDEREIGVYSGFVSLKENKLYFNYTDHIMDNGLRNGMSSMITDANNLTIGLSGNFYEVYYRNWNADNEINTPMMKIENHLMPDVRQYSIKFHKNLNLDKFTVSGKIGLIHNKIGDSQRLSFYQQLYSDAENDRWSGILGLGVGFTEALSKDLAIGALAEFASDVPQIEYLYVSVKKPMNKPYWSGNPKLSNPKKTTLRGKVNYRHFDFEVFSTRVWDYVNLTKSTINNQNFVTYENVESQMMGFNLRVNWQYVNVNAAYTWAKNVTNDSPLTEIPPFSLITTINSPSFKGFQAFIKHTYNDAQVRVDDNQDELHSPSWHSFNSGIAYLLNSLRFSVEIDNLFNEQYYRHLSYMRNPFSSGNQIYEPGRLVRINVTYN